MARGSADPDVVVCPRFGLRQIGGRVRHMGQAGRALCRRSCPHQREIIDMEQDGIPRAVIYDAAVYGGFPECENKPHP